MFCVEEHKWGYFMRIYIGALGRHLHLGERVLTWGRRVPASALPSWGSMPQLGNKKMYCICLSRHRALTSKCRRGDEAAEKSPDVGRRYRCKYLRISLEISNFTSNSNTL